MREVAFVAYVEYSDGVIGFVSDDFESADKAEEGTRERFANKTVLEYVEREHGGVERIMVRESKEVRNVMF